MRTFYEEWSFLEENFEIADTVEKKEIVKLESAGSKTETAIWNPLVPKQTDFPFKAFFSIGFSHHRTILAKVKDVKERIFYVIRCSEEKYSREELTRSIERDDYHHLGHHIELYSHIQSLSGTTTIKACDNFIKQQAQYDASIHRKPYTFGNVTYETLPTYIRNCIDHPGTGYSYSDEELKNQSS